MLRINLLCLYNTFIFSKWFFFFFFVISFDLYNKQSLEQGWVCQMYRWGNRGPGMPHACQQGYHKVLRPQSKGDSCCMNPAEMRHWKCGTKSQLNFTSSPEYLGNPCFRLKWNYCSTCLCFPYRKEKKNWSGGLEPGMVSFSVGVYFLLE